jgi:beta-glucosidase
LIFDAKLRILGGIIFIFENFYLPFGGKLRSDNRWVILAGYRERINTLTIASDYLQTPEGKPGLKVEYFANKNLEGDPVMVRTDETVAFNWDKKSPSSEMISRGEWPSDKALPADNFSIRWTGKLIPPQTKLYELSVRNDDGCRLYIDDKMLINDWSEHFAQSSTAKIQLEQGKAYNIRLEYFESSKEAEMTLGWDLGVPKEVNSFDQAVEFTRQADVAIFVGGLSATLEGEEMSVPYPGFAGGDRKDINLPQTQAKMLQAMQATGKPVVFVLLTGSAVAVNWEQENLPAILCGWYPGQHGDAVADVLFGTYNPAGRLPVTFYKSIDQLPPFENYDMQGRTYRYFKGEPLYPFGHGLSYTAFKYSDLKINKKQAAVDDAVEISFTIANTGKIDGDEVPQLYVRDVEFKLPMPLKQLRGFKRIHLKAGESKTITFKLTPNQDMNYYDAKKSDYAVEPGDFEIQIGSSSADVRLKGIAAVK